MSTEFVFTSESVTSGHPDKLCDQISDALVGQYLWQDPLSRIVAECAASTSIVFISVKHSSEATVDAPRVAREVIEQVGYANEVFNHKTCAVMTSLHEVATGSYPRVDESSLDEDELERVVSQDQVTVFGFACTHTPARMPLPIWLAHRLARRIDDVRLDGLGELAPDAKTQVGVEFRELRPARIHSISIVASQRSLDALSVRALGDAIRDEVIAPVFAEEPVRPDRNTRIAINPEGPVVEGGPAVHAGLTGRKTGVDTYGEWSRQSGSALSGKDPSRIDRVGAYAARYAAKNVVAAGLASECEVQLSYSIGLSRPVSVRVRTFGTGRVPDLEIATRIERAFDLRIAGIVRELRLRPLPAATHGDFYRRLAVYGHMGRDDLDVPWEATDRVDVLR